MGVPYDSLLFEVRDQIATITLNRPERRNAWTVAMANELHDALSRCHADDGVRVVIMTGAGDKFSVGADLDHGSIEMNEPGTAAPRHLSPQDLRKPVIAAINGDAVGIGTSYSLLCDIRVVADNARMGFLFVRRGVIPELGMSWIAPRLVGLSGVSELMLTGRLFGAQEAYRIGLCHRVVPAWEVLPVARSIATEIVENVAPLSAAIAKSYLWEGLDQHYQDAYDREQDAFRWSTHTADATEGIAAFLEKRKPRWTGRPSIDLEDLN